MKLSMLTGAPSDPDPEITGITADSRRVKPGFLFAALSGVNADGAKFIPQAEKNGAAAILASHRVMASCPVIIDREPRRRLAEFALRFFGPGPATMAGVTGTNGKTSVARFAEQLWCLLGETAGSIGTLGAHAPNFEKKLQHTTPEPVVLHETLSAMAKAGVTHAAMEISSHALAQHRADSVSFQIAAFTNITQDHLDYHSDFASYFQAKKRLFTDLLLKEGAAVINADGAGAPEMLETARASGARVFATGVNGDYIRVLSVAPRPAGLMVKVETGGEELEVALPLIGAFQAENAVLAAGIVAASGFDPRGVIPFLREITGAPGRMEHVSDMRGGAIYVDYAHTPAAVETAILAIRPHAAGRVIVIIGAGGDRDKDKRPMMGAAASKADAVIVTDDNPRTEEPSSIRHSVKLGAPDALDIGDRAEAIAAGVSMMREGDVLLIAGKGHETGQTIGDQTIAFNDAEQAREAVRLQSAARGR